MRIYTDKNIFDSISADLFDTGLKKTLIREYPYSSAKIRVRIYLKIRVRICLKIRVRIRHCNSDKASVHFMLPASKGSEFHCFFGGNFFRFIEVLF